MRPKKLLVSWNLTLTGIALRAEFVDLEARTRGALDYTLERAKVVEMRPDVRMACIVQAFGVLVRRINPEHTEDHIVHATNAAAILLSVLETKVHTSRFEWIEG